jgi:hypothetical protein
MLERPHICPPFDVPLETTQLILGFASCVKRLATVTNTVSRTISEATDAAPSICGGRTCGSPAVVKSRSDPRRTRVASRL